MHFGLVHIGFNMIVLLMVGKVFEPGTGPIRFATLYVVSVLAGAAGALIATPHGLNGGASGGIFGVAAAATLVMQRRGTRFWDTGFGPLLVLNLVFGLFESNVSIGGHIGGLIGGAITAELMMQAAQGRDARARIRRRRVVGARVGRARVRRGRALVARGQVAGTSSTAPVSSSSTRR